jgi:hypothetical protein
MRHTQPYEGVGVFSRNNIAAILQPFWSAFQNCYACCGITYADIVADMCSIFAVGVGLINN